MIPVSCPDPAIWQVMLPSHQLAEFRWLHAKYESLPKFWDTIYFQFLSPKYVIVNHRYKIQIRKTKQKYKTQLDSLNLNTKREYRLKNQWSHVYSHL